MVNDVRRTLCLCNTYFQLIVLIQMKQTLLKECQVDVLLSDHSANAATIAARLQQENIFSNVTLICTKESDKKQKGIWKEIKSILSIVSLKTASWLKQLEEVKYDELLFFNIGLSTIALYNVLKGKNPDLVCSIYEEGVFNYNAPQLFLIEKGLSGRVRFAESVNALHGRKKLLRDIRTFYCMYPQLYQGPLSVCKIPVGDMAATEKTLQKAFLAESTALGYQQKYIYLSSICDFEGGTSIGELALVKQIAALVGQKNLLVKVHPRDEAKRFLREGLCVDENSDIPWEVVQMNGNFSGHVLLTATSASVLSGVLLSKQKTRVYFLYPLCNTEGNCLAKRSIAALNDVLVRLQDNMVLQNVHICKELREILSEK